MEKFKLGIIGLNKSHTGKFNFIKKHFSKIDLIAAHTVRNSDMLYAKNELSLQYLYDDPKKLADNNDIDAVLIWSSAKDHASHAILALESNKHVLLELPFATNKDDGTALMAAAMRRPSQICYCPFNYMVNPMILKANEWIDKGTIGTPFMIQSVIQGAAYEDENELKQKDIFSGDALEVIALVMSLTGKKYDSVESQGTIASDATLRLTNDFDLAQVQAKMSENCFAQFSISRIGQKKSFSIFIQGSKGDMTLSSNGLSYANQDGTKTYSGENYFRYKNAFQIATLNSFIDQIATRGKSENDLKDAFHVSLVASAMAKSLLLKEKVTL